MKFARIAAGLAVGVGLGVASFMSSALAEDTTLRITLQLPMKSHLGQNVALFKEKVEDLSNGEVSVEIYDSAQLYKDSEVPQAVGSGAIEMGVASLTRYVGDVPAVDLFYMPFLLNNEELVRKAVAPDSPVRAPLDEAILGTGSRVLWWQAYGGVVLLSKEAPLKTPADIEGKKVRVFGKTLGEWIKAAGGAPTLISGFRAVYRLSARHGRHRHDRCVRREEPAPLGGDGHDHRHQQRGHRVHRGGQRGLLAGPAGAAPRLDYPGCARVGAGRA